MKPIDISEILKKHKKGWLALSPDNRKFITSGKTLEEVLVRAQKKGIARPSVMKAVTFDKHFYIG